MSVSFDDPKDFLAEEQRKLRRRLIAHLESRTSDLCDAPMRLASSNYTDPVRFEAEKAMFCAVPLIAGLSNEIPNPGDRILFDAAGPAIVIVRNQDGTVNAFLNLCPHRGSRLVDNCEPDESFLCPFHAWRFDLNGELIRRPRADAFDEDGKTAPVLIAVPVVEWHGLIFVRATPNGKAIDVEGFLGDMAPILKGLELDQVIPVKNTLVVNVETNWKLNLDTFCEAYHVPTVHKPSFGANVVPYVAVEDVLGSHGRYIGAAVDLKELAGIPESEWPDSTYNAVQILFPNVSLTLTDTVDRKTPMLTMFRIFPGETVGSSVCLMNSYIHESGKDLELSQFKQLTDHLMQVVIDEDYGNACNTWQGLKNAATNDIQFVFGRNEAVLQNYHRVLASTIDMPLE